ncbi:hypothetical protein [Gaopeijia maritima]|uniref:ATP-binding protein n=1 Tax=Gaopeijia maritima TaxID=3119007 RepID=A0ABU9ECZ3_9BACT
MASVINEAFMRFTRRAEVVDRARLVATFVDAGPLMTLLESRDHQIVYGRRGTGKTHALSYLVEDRRKKGDVSLYVDLRLIGSSGGIYADPNLLLEERATRLLIDTLAALHDSLVDYTLGEDLDLSMIGPVLDRLADSIAEVSVVGTVEREQEATAQDEEHSHRSAEAGLDPVAAAVRVAGGRSSKASRGRRERVTEAGVARHRVHFGRVGASLIDLSRALDRHTWVVLDEWSSVPLDLQPYLADLLRRTLLPTPGYTVKFGAIEQRSRFRLSTPEGDYVGIEVGADMAADVNLDDFMVFENDPDRAKDFFRELLFRHLRAVLEDEHVDAPATPSQLTNRAFTQVTAFDEFIRAAEGVPRDAINVAGLAAQRALNDAISVEHVRTAARSWYQRDKEAAVGANPTARALLHWAIDRVIGDRRARAFLLRSDISHPLIDTLFDARVLHILKKSIAAHDQPGIRYDVYKLDYGCYVDLITTVRAPQGLLPVGNENAEAGFVEVPPDDYRSIRRAILDLTEFEDAQGPATSAESVGGTA